MQAFSNAFLPMPHTNLCSLCCSAAYLLPEGVCFCPMAGWNFPAAVYCSSIPVCFSPAPVYNSPTTVCYCPAPVCFSPVPVC
jgi:hypothetical protein